MVLPFEVTGMDAKENSRRKVLRRPGRATQFVRVSFVNFIIISVECGLFPK